MFSTHDQKEGMAAFIESANRVPRQIALFRVKPLASAAPGRSHQKLLAVSALLLGALAIGSSALFVKVSETAPVATAFWRVFLALPFLCAWSVIGQGHRHRASFAAERGLLIAAGLFFAGDLAFWHWSIVLTSVANSTLLANLAPIFVTLAAWLLFHKQLGMKFVTGLAIALTGMVVLIGGDFRLSTREIVGDGLGIVTAMFYAGYQLSVTRLRARVATSTLMAWSGLITTIVLLPAALISGGQLLPVSGSGWTKLIALALISQVAGQSLIVRDGASAGDVFLGRLFQPVAAAVLAWLLLGESLACCKSPPASP
jgi:drug/metabolite transporter (DMT)-like permease